MGIAIGVGVALFIAWFFLRSGDSSYEFMADQINKEAEAQTEANLERDRQREAEAKAAKHEAAMKKAKYALLNHPKYFLLLYFFLLFEVRLLEHVLLIC